MKFVEYLENAARLDRAAAEIDLPNFKALLLRQAEAYRQLRNERAAWTADSQDPAVVQDQ